MATKMPVTLGTSLTPGFTDLLANWDQVLQSLDRVSAYTASRAQEPLSARLGQLRGERPQLLGETPDGSEWQTLQSGAGGGYPSNSKGEETRNPQEFVDPCVSRSNQIVRPTGAAVALERLEHRFAREEAKSLLQLILGSWRSIRKEPKVDGDEARLQETLKIEREKLQRVQETRQSRCAAALKCWQQVQIRDTLSFVFNVWREDIQKKAEALQKHQLSQSTLEATQASEVQNSLRRELSESRAAQEASAADAASARMALHVAEEEMTRLRLELATSNEQLFQLKAPRELPASLAPDPVKESERSRQLADLSIKLARAEAEVAETKAQLEPLKGQLVTARRQLEMAYALLNKEQDARKGNSRDRDLAITHLWQILERLQEVPHVDEKKAGDSPSAMSTPNIQSSLSLPSLSSASSPSVRSRSKPTSGDGVKRWTAPWS